MELCHSLTNEQFAYLVQLAKEDAEGNAEAALKVRGMVGLASRNLKSVGDEIETLWGLLRGLGAIGFQRRDAVASDMAEAIKDVYLVNQGARPEEYNVAVALCAEREAIANKFNGVLIQHTPDIAVDFEALLDVCADPGSGIKMELPDEPAE